MYLGVQFQIKCLVFCHLLRFQVAMPTSGFPYVSYIVGMYCTFRNPVLSQVLRLKWGHLQHQLPGDFNIAYMGYCIHTCIQGNCLSWVCFCLICLRSTYKVTYLLERALSNPTVDIPWPPWCREVKTFFSRRREPSSHQRPSFRGLVTVGLGTLLQVPSIWYKYLSRKFRTRGPELLPWLINSWLLRRPCLVYHTVPIGGPCSNLFSNEQWCDVILEISNSAGRPNRWMLTYGWEDVSVG
jgi:hypothetical protein